MIRFDCHAHVYDDATPVDGARYTPSGPAPLDRWLSLQETVGLSGGVIVQVSFLGTDNSQLLDALGRLDRTRFAGIACVPLDAPEREIRALAEAGVRGIRWNLVAGVALPDLESAEVQRLLVLLAAHDMHLEVQLESTRWADYLAPLSSAPVPVVIDHLGLPVSDDAADEPWLDALERCTHRDVFHVKLSARYRGVRNIGGHLNRVEHLLGPGRAVWGSDWPHTRFETVARYDEGLDDLAGRLNDGPAVRKLYGIG